MVESSQKTRESTCPTEMQRHAKVILKSEGIIMINYAFNRNNGDLNKFC